MTRAASRAWTTFCAIGIVLWIGVTVAVAVINDDPSDGRPVLLAFAGGGAAFFGAMFAAAWWQTRPRSSPELDALVAELSLDPHMGPRSARAVGGMRAWHAPTSRSGRWSRRSASRRSSRRGSRSGTPRTTTYAMVAIVVIWAAAVPSVIRRANAASRAVLTPLGLSRNGATLSGDRHGRGVSVSIGPKGR